MNEHSYSGKAKSFIINSTELYSLVSWRQVKSLHPKQERTLGPRWGTEVRMWCFAQVSWTKTGVVMRMRVFAQLYTVHHFLDSILCPLTAKASFPFASALQDPCFSVRGSRFRCVCFLLPPGLEFAKQCKIKSKPNCLQLAARLPLSIRALQPPCRSEVDLFLPFIFVLFSLSMLSALRVHEKENRAGSAHPVILE